MLTLPTLQPGDSVDIIAPASRCTAAQLDALKALLESWQLHCIIADTIFGNDPFCANTDENRLTQLINAFTNTKSKAIICARGGYGSMRLIPALTQTAKPKNLKLFVGMSDITALHLYLQQQWHWPTIHGAAAPDRFSTDSITALKAILFGNVKQVEFNGLIPLNTPAKKNHSIQGVITGGNLSLIQASIGTPWQLEGRDKIILLEDTSERGYRLDRMLQHLMQTGVLQNASAILLGDFTEGQEANGQSFVEIALERFATHCAIPVVQLKGIGHGYTNFPLPLGTVAHLNVGTDITLNCSLASS